MEKCIECGKEFEKLGMHWRYNKKHRPSYTQKQNEIIKGLLMSDAWLSKRKENPRLCIENTNEKYLRYLKEVFGAMGCEVRLKESAKKSAKNARKSGFRPDAKEENYKDVYYFTLRSHPELKRYSGWYSSGKKVWPQKLEMNPNTLKHLYCGDGSYERSLDKISIAARNERGNKKKLEKYFSKNNLPKPKWHESKVEDGRLFSMYWYSEEARELFDYMGAAPPGFGYKWP